VAVSVDAHLVPRSLVYATDIDVLPIGHVVERRDRYLVVRSPGNPTHYWGNLLLFDEPPERGDRARWERLFEAEFAEQPLTRIRTFGWDQTGDAPGAAREEFAAHGYDLERSVGLIAAPDRIRPHPRASRTVEVRPLDPRLPVEEPLWDQVLEIQVAGRDLERFSEESHRRFCRRRLADLRDLFAAGRGAWYAALAGDEVVGSCGVVVTDGRGRFQAVDTAAGHRRQGICSRLVVDAAQHAAAKHGARRLVIVADPDYHALGIYESLGFQRVERVCGVCQAEGG
jgi:ribosomal protein S18 acetylase RimI-like enzyme